MRGRFRIDELLIESLGSDADPIGDIRELEFREEFKQGRRDCYPRVVLTRSFNPKPQISPVEVGSRPWAPRSLIEVTNSVNVTDVPTSLGEEVRSSSKKLWAAASSATGSEWKMRRLVIESVDCARVRTP